jgi:hypothetical protein
VELLWFAQIGRAKDSLRITDEGPAGMFVNQGGPFLKCPAAMKQSRAYRFAGNNDSFLARHPGPRDPLHAVGPLSTSGDRSVPKDI